MSDSPSTGLVRNVSLPVLAQGQGTATSPQIPGVPRVSSFSTIAKPSQLSMYPSYDTADSSDDEADGMVPQVFSNYGPERCTDSEPLLTHVENRAPSSDTENVDQHHHTDRDTKSNSNNPILATMTISTQPSFIFSSSSKPRSRSSLLEHIRAAITTAVYKLQIFVPPSATKRHSGSTDVELKFLFLAAVSLMLFPCASLLSYALHVWKLQFISLLILLVPIVARVTSGVNLATALLIVDIIGYTITATPFTSPVILVWTSLVPVVAFTTLGNRVGLAASAGTAAYILQAELPTQGGELAHDGTVSVIAAVWVLFLGCLGVVQTQIRGVAVGDREVFEGVEWERDAVVPDSTGSLKGEFMYD